MIAAATKRVGHLVETGADIVFLTADIGGAGIEPLCRSLGDRFIDVGIAEATMVGVATGFGLSGTKPIIYGLASFLTRRPLEQIKIDLVENGVSAVILGGASGATLSALGPTHIANDDIALMRSLGSVRILSPRTATQAADALEYALGIGETCYIRLSPDSGAQFSESEFGSGEPECIASGEEVLLLTIGACSEIAFAAREELRLAGSCVPAVVHLRTIFPLDPELIRQLVAPYQSIVTIEDHARNGGIGSILGETLADIDETRKMTRIGFEACATNVVWDNGKGNDVSLLRKIVESVEHHAGRVCND